VQPATAAPNNRSSSLVETVSTTPDKPEARTEQAEPTQEDNSNPDLAPARENRSTDFVKKTAEGSAKADLEKLVTEAGYTFDHLQKVGMQTGLVDGADSISGFDEITEKNAKRLLNAKAGLLAKLAEAKEGK
jgi:hypothetical protein